MFRFGSSLVASCLAASCGVLTGCASILGGGGHQVVTFTSAPRGAQIRIRDTEGKEIYAAATPTRVDLNRGAGYFRPASYTIDVKAAGYPERAVPLKAGFNPWYLGNGLFGGLIGLVVVDPLTGAMWTLPDSVNLDMTHPAPGTGKAGVVSAQQQRKGPEAQPVVAVR